MIKKIIYGSAYGMLGMEATAITFKFYELYKSGATLSLMAGVPVAPYWLIVEGTFVGLAPILTKYLLKAFNNDGLSDESDLVGLIKKINKRKEKNHGIE